MALVISFVLELKTLTEVFMIMSSLYYYRGSAQVNGVIHGERSTRVGSDRMIEMASLFLYRLVFG